MLDRVRRERDLLFTACQNALRLLEVSQRPITVIGTQPVDAAIAMLEEAIRATSPAVPCAFVNCPAAAGFELAPSEPEKPRIHACGGHLDCYLRLGRYTVTPLC